MEREQIRVVVVEAIVAALRASGVKAPTLAGEDKPLLDADGFDSLLGIEATSAIEKKLGLPLEKIDSLFVDLAHPTRALTVNQIVARLAKLAKQRGAA